MIGFNGGRLRVRAPVRPPRRRAKILSGAKGSPNEATPAQRDQLRVAATAAVERHARPVYSRLERPIVMKAGMKKG
jgi:hypothetical protein